MATRKRKAVPSADAHGKNRSAVSGELVTSSLAGRNARADSSERTVHPRSPRLSQAQQRTEFLIEALGSATELAHLLDVSRSQPGKWRTGEESPGPAASAMLVDLDHVMARATLLWPAEVVKRWLVGTEPFLGGARPIDVLRLRGPRDVIDALDAVTAGAYA